MIYPSIRFIHVSKSLFHKLYQKTSLISQMEAGGWSLLEEVSVACSAAEERTAVGEYRLGDEALGRLVRAATRLRLLDLRGLQRLTDSGLVRVPAWDLQHLFLGGTFCTCILYTYYIHTCSIFI